MDNLIFTITGRQIQWKLNSYSHGSRLPPNFFILLQFTMVLLVVNDTPLGPGPL